jgi:isopentenyl-diphosphate delta-isomerase
LKEVKQLSDSIEERKADHIEICLEEDVQTRKATTGFEDITLVHNALPEIERKKVDLSTTVFGYKFSAPIFVGAMTGGTAKAQKINAAIAEAVETLNLGMGVGSQRAAIDNPELEHSFRVAREKASKAFIFANLGGAQLVNRYDIKEARRAVEMVEANALAIHLNALQEAVQPEGETDYSGLINRISKVAQALEVPVIVKETGAGVAAEEAKMLEEAGVAGIDVAGVGGTSWAAVEYYRAKRHQDKFNQRLGETFWDWGIPTAVSLVETIQSVSIPVIASGGIRNGIEITKALALGAGLVSVSYPILQPATKGPEEVKKVLQSLIEELRTAMFLVGADSVKKLKEIPMVLTGKTAERLRTRGFQPELYVRRRT